MTTVKFDDAGYPPKNPGIFMPSRYFDDGCIQMMPCSLRNHPALEQSISRVVRHNHVGYIGDSHGNYLGFVANMSALGWIKDAHYHIPPDNQLVILGDIVVDRNTSGLQILLDVHKIRDYGVQINSGAQIDLFAGNHEDLLFSFFFRRKHANLNDVVELCGSENKGIGLLEFGKFQGLDLSTCTLEDLDPEKILSGMRSSEEGRILLETLSSMKICTQIDDTLFVHTDMTDEMAEMLLSNDIETLNAIFQRNLRNFLLHGIREDDIESFHRIRDIFLSTFNSRHIDFQKPSSAIRLSEENAYKLREKYQINRIIHGHSDHSEYDATGGLIRQTRSIVIGLLEVIAADHSAYKDFKHKGRYYLYRHHARSVGMIIPSNGTRYTHYE